MYRFLCNSVIGHVDKYALSNSAELVAISLAASDIACRSMVQAFKNRGGGKDYAMLYNHDKPKNSPGSVNLDLFHGKEILLETKALSAIPGYKTIAAYADGRNSSNELYCVVAEEDKAEDIPFLWHKMVEERNNRVISLRRWAPVIWRYLDKDLKIVKQIPCYNLVGFQVEIEDELLQRVIIDLVKSGRMKELPNEA